MPAASTCPPTPSSTGATGSTRPNCRAPGPTRWRRRSGTPSSART
ncbi:hypothetical protein ACFQVA_41185 [Actinomadura keratinilytica]